MSPPDAYAQSGVSYDVLDRAKRAALTAAGATSSLGGDVGAHFLEASRGEPASVIELDGIHLGFVLECLGTKSLIARDYEKASGVDRFASIGYDTVAAIVNDCCCVGALPFVVHAYFASGSAAFYSGSRHENLVAGFASACKDAGAAWGGGESPSLAGLVLEDGIDLAGAAIGRVPAGVEPLTGEALRGGDEIVLVCSSGLHTNGASLARRVVGELDDGLLHRLGSGQVLGEALLTPSLLYVDLVRALFREQVPVHYLTHITGHGLRKLMRAKAAFTYKVTTLLEVPEVLAFLVERAGLSPREAYATFNMGAGFACMVEKGAGEKVVGLAEKLGHRAVVAGVVLEGERSVELEPLGIAYASEELSLS